MLNGGTVRCPKPLSSGSRWELRWRGGLQQLLAAGVSEAGGGQQPWRIYAMLVSEQRGGPQPEPARRGQPPPRVAEAAGGVGKGRSVVAAPYGRVGHHSELGVSSRKKLSWHIDAWPPWPAAELW